MKIENNVLIHNIIYCFHNVLIYCIVYCFNFPIRINVCGTAFKYKLSQVWPPSFNQPVYFQKVEER